MAEHEHKTEELDEYEAYCATCTTSRPVAHGKDVTLKNDVLAVQGQCPVCGRQLTRIKSGGPVLG